MTTVLANAWRCTIVLAPANTALSLVRAPCAQQIAFAGAERKTSMVGELAVFDMHTHPAGMFVVTEAEAAAIRAVFEQSGEFAAVELRGCSRPSSTPPRPARVPGPLPAGSPCLRSPGPAIAPAGGLIGLSQQLPVRPGRPLGPACPTESERAPVTIQAKIGSD